MKCKETLQTKKNAVKLHRLPPDINPNTERSVTRRLKTFNLNINFIRSQVNSLNFSSNSLSAKQNTNNK